MAREIPLLTCNASSCGFYDRIETRIFNDEQHPVGKCLHQARNMIVIEGHECRLGIKHRK